MLRLSCHVGRGTGRCALPVLTTALRRSHQEFTSHDFSGCFTRKLTADEEESLRIMQRQRPVSAVVPGKVFMRHWIAAEQSTVSAVDRVMSGIVFVCLMLWACGYSTLGHNGYNCAQTACWALLAYWLVFYTHCTLLLPVFVGIALMQLLLN